MRDLVAAWADSPRASPQIGLTRLSVDGHPGAPPLRRLGPSGVLRASESGGAHIQADAVIEEQEQEHRSFVEQLHAVRDALREDFDLDIMKAFQRLRHMGTDRSVTLSPVTGMPIGTCPGWYTVRAHPPPFPARINIRNWACSLWLYGCDAPANTCIVCLTLEMHATYETIRYCPAILCLHLTSARWGSFSLAAFLFIPHRHPQTGLVFLGEPRRVASTSALGATRVCSRRGGVGGLLSAARQAIRRPLLVRRATARWRRLLCGSLRDCERLFTPGGRYQAP